jgi:hypothetical protein
MVWLLIVVAAIYGIFMLGTAVGIDSNRKYNNVNKSTVMSNRTSSNPPNKSSSRTHGGTTTTAVNNTDYGDLPLQLGLKRTKKPFDKITNIERNRSRYIRKYLQDRNATNKAKLSEFMLDSLEKDYLISILTDESLYYYCEKTGDEIGINEIVERGLYTRIVDYTECSPVQKKQEDIDEVNKKKLIDKYVKTGSEEIAAELQSKNITVDRSVMIGQLNNFEVIDIYRETKDDIFKQELIRRNLSDYINE